MSSSVNNVAFATIVRKEVRRFMRIWTQTLLPPAITMTLYFLIFGQLVGSRIGDMNGVSYMQFIMPGLVMMAVITNSYNNVVSSFFSAKFQKNIEELIVSPVGYHTVLLGYIAGGLIRGLLIGVIVVIVSLFFTEIDIHNALVMIYTILNASFLFSVAGLINALYAKSFDDISIVPTFILTPLTYLGGVFYSLEQLGDFWRQVSLFNPILYMINAFRYGMLGISDVPVSMSLILTSIMAITLYGIAYALFKKRGAVQI